MMVTVMTVRAPARQLDRILCLRRGALLGAFDVAVQLGKRALRLVQVAGRQRLPKRVQIVGNRVRTAAGSGAGGVVGGGSCLVLERLLQVGEGRLRFRQIAGVQCRGELAVILLHELGIIWRLRAGNVLILARGRSVRRIRRGRIGRALTRRLQISLKLLKCALDRGGVSGLERLPQRRKVALQGAGAVQQRGQRGVGVVLQCLLQVGVGRLGLGNVAGLDGGGHLAEVLPGLL